MSQRPRARGRRKADTVAAAAERTTWVAIAVAVAEGLRIALGC